MQRQEGGLGTRHSYAVVSIFFRLPSRLLGGVPIFFILSFPMLVTMSIPVSKPALHGKSYDGQVMLDAAVEIVDTLVSDTLEGNAPGDWYDTRAQGIKPIKHGHHA